MASALRPIGHEDRLSLVDHLDELRRRLIVSVVTFVVAFIGCYAFNQTLLGLLDRPLGTTTATAQSGSGRLSQTAQAQVDLAAGLRAASEAAERLSRSPALTTPPDRAATRDLARSLGQSAQALPRALPPRKPVTLGVAEPFTTTLLTAAYFALLVSLPVVLFQLYAFILPAFSPHERRVALPLMAMVPVLFISGVAFAYFFVLPAAIGFLQNYNTDSFDVLLGARDLYRFEIMTMLALGLVFQVPVGMLAANRVGLVTAAKLRRWWRYAIVGCVAVAALLPGVDPVTTLLEAIPLLLLYGLSIVLLQVYDRSPEGSDDEDDEDDDEWDPYLEDEELGDRPPGGSTARA